MVAYAGTELCRESDKVGWSGREKSRYFEIMRNVHRRGVAKRYVLAKHRQNADDRSDFQG